MAAPTAATIAVLSAAAVSVKLNVSGANPIAVNEDNAPPDIADIAPPNHASILAPLCTFSGCRSGVVYDRSSFDQVGEDHDVCCH